MTCRKTRNEEYAGGFPLGMEAFKNLPDPRSGKAKRHYFGEILFIALAAMVCGMEGFVECFITHVRSIRPDLAGELIAIDRKTLRHSFDHGDPENSLHLISA